MTTELNDFIHEIDKIISREDSSIDDCERPLKSFLHSSALYETINAELRQVATRPLYVPPYLHGTSLIIHATEKWTLMYSLYEHVPAHLYTFPMSSLIAPLGNSELQYHLYELPKEYVNGVFDRTIRPIKKHSATARYGDIIRVNGAAEIFDLQIISPQCVLKFLIPNSDTLQWTFDRTTYAPLYPIAATATGSELSVIAQVLGALKNKSSANNLIRLSKEHPQHQVRWEAIKALAKVDFELGLDAVKHAVNDNHPHVAYAAQRTLSKQIGT